MLKYGTSRYLSPDLLSGTNISPSSSRAPESNGQSLWNILRDGFLSAGVVRQTQEPGNLVTTTVRDYDLAEVSKLVRFFSLSGYCYSILFRPPNTSFANQPVLRLSPYNFPSHFRHRHTTIHPSLPLTPIPPPSPSSSHPSPPLLFLTR